MNVNAGVLIVGLQPIWIGARDFNCQNIWPNYSKISNSSVKKAVAKCPEKENLIMFVLNKSDIRGILPKNV